MNDRAVELYEFGRFRLDLSEQRLLRDHELVPLPPKVLDTLAVLVKHSGHIQSKEELISAVWGETFVEESSLSRNISLLRKALQEEENEKYIETIPKRGYRFVAPVRIVDTRIASLPRGRNGEKGHHLEARVFKPATQTGNGTGAVKSHVDTGFLKGNLRLVAGLLTVVLVSLVGVYIWRGNTKKSSTPAVSGESQISSLAVLPFRVLGPGGEPEFAGLGMADAIILRLSGSRTCRIRPTSAISKYAGTEFDALRAGQELDVDAVLDGTVQHAGGRVRVTVVLWALKDGNPIWSGKFDEPFSDIFSLQDSVSTQVANNLRRFNIESPERRNRFTQNVEAYRHYTMGYYFRSRASKANFAKAIQYFGEAIKEDSNYALAYSSLADTYLLDAYYGYANVQFQEAYEKAKEATAQAIRLDESLPEANIANGMIKQFEGDLIGAENSFRKAIELNPSSPTARLRYGHILAATSRLDQAIAELRIAQDIDPVSSWICISLGGYLLLARQYDEAIKYSRLALELDPEYSLARENLAWAYAGKGMYSEATAEFNALTKTFGSCPNADAGVAYITAKQGLSRQARELLNQTKVKFKPNDAGAGTSLQIAKAFCALGEKEEAFDWLKRAVHTGLRAYELEYSAELDPLKADTRFAQMIEQARNLGPALTGHHLHAD